MRRGTLIAAAASAITAIVTGMAVAIVGARGDGMSDTANGGAAGESTRTSLGLDLKGGSRIELVAPVPTFDYRTPFAPFNDGEGPCRNPTFSIVSAPAPERVYHDGETLEVTIRYDAPGCAQIGGYFGVRHVVGSPRERYYCKHTCPRGFDGNIPAREEHLASSSGTITLVAQPGTFPPADLASVPDLEGAQLCAIAVTVDDGRPGGSRSSQQLNVGCADEWYPSGTATPTP